MRKFFSIVLLVSLSWGVVSSASDGQMLYDTLLNLRQTSGGSSSGGFVLPEPIFWAPFDDLANPLKLYRGTGALSFTRATTATYVHPTTGLVTTASAGQLRIEANGALIEGQRTNLLLWSRDMTNVAWTKTTMTAALDQTGEDGVANSASSLLATGANATCVQSLTQAANPFSASISIKRITGTGAVSISLDNGTISWVDVTSSLSTTGWYRAKVENQTLTNPILRLQLATSGDKVVVDYAGVEQGAFASSRIPATSTAVTRNGDELTAPTSGNVDGAVGTAVLQFDYSSNVIGGLIGLSTIATSTLANIRALGMEYHDGTNNAWTTYALPAVQLTPRKFGVKWGGVLTTGYLDGVKGVDATFDGAYPVGATMYIGRTKDHPQPFGHIKNLLIFNRALTDAEMQSITK